MSSHRARATAAVLPAVWQKTHGSARELTFASSANAGLASLGFRGVGGIVLGLVGRGVAAAQDAISRPADHGARAKDVSHDHLSRTFVTVSGRPTLTMAA